MRPDTALRRATARRDDAEQRWRDAIRHAHKAGLSHRKIAPLAGISHQRVAQLLAE